MGVSENMEEYLGTIRVLENLRDKIEAERIRFCDLGADLIGEVAEAGFEIGQSKEEKEASQEFVQALMDGYRSIRFLNQRKAELAYLDMLIGGLRAWMLMVKREDMDLLAKLKEKQGTLLPYDPNKEECGKEKHIWMDVRELFLQQNASFVDMDYQRLDVVVKYLAIEHYFQKNKDGFLIYQKLQSMRQKQSVDMPEGYDMMAQYVFFDLIKLVEKDGFLEESELTCDSRLFLMDGAHRLALCLYFGISKVRVKVLDEQINIPPFTLAYLKESGFTEKECSIIERKARELINKCKVNVTCTLWPPVADYFDNITQDIRNVCKVVSVQDYTYSEETFPRIVRGVYHVDDIAEWKIEKKLGAMQFCLNKQIRVLQLEILAPYFRLKEMNLNTISIVGERLKALVRERYRGVVQNYIYDIIIHTGDNFYQNEYMEKLFLPVFSMEEYLQGLRGFRYFLIKHETPYMPKDFPKSYAFSKDIDIISTEEDFVFLSQYTEDFLKKWVSGYEARVLKKEAGVLYRVELKGFLMIQLDIGVGISGIRRGFWEQALENRQMQEGYYIPMIRDEICIRVNEYLKNPAKTHHLQYLKEHAAAFDMGWLEQYLEYGRKQYQQIEFLIKER